MKNERLHFVKLLLVSFGIALFFSCSQGNQPKCNSIEAVVLLKEVLADGMILSDTTYWDIESIRTKSKEPEFHQCECTASIKSLTDKGWLYNRYHYGDWLRNGIINYTVQYSDDGENLNVTVHE